MYLYKTWWFFSFISLFVDKWFLCCSASCPCLTSSTSVLLNILEGQDRFRCFQVRIFIIFSFFQSSVYHNYPKHKHFNGSNPRYHPVSFINKQTNNYPSLVPSIAVRGDRWWGLPRSRTCLCCRGGRSLVETGLGVGDSSSTEALWCGVLEPAYRPERQTKLIQ